MVDSIRPIYRSLPTPNLTDKVKEASQVETHNDDKAGQDYIANKDRRNRRDRRKSRAEKRPVYDMRSGVRGRRKEDGEHTIEIKV